MNYGIFTDALVRSMVVECVSYKIVFPNNHRGRQRFWAG